MCNFLGLEGLPGSLSIEPSLISLRMRTALPKQLEMELTNINTVCDVWDWTAFSRLS